MFKFVILLYFLIHLNLHKFASSLVELHFNLDQSYLTTNLQTNKNAVTLEKMPMSSDMTNPLIDISCCLRMKLDFISRQVK
jgi:hypothetical protein